MNVIIPGSGGCVSTPGAYNLPFSKFRKKGVKILKQSLLNETFCQVDSYFI